MSTFYGRDEQPPDKDCNCVLCDYRRAFPDPSEAEIKKVTRLFLKYVLKCIRHILIDEHFHISMAEKDTNLGHFYVFGGLPVITKLAALLGFSPTPDVKITVLEEEENREKHERN